jgi:hypothetical protein
VELMVNDHRQVIVYLGSFTRNVARVRCLAADRCGSLHQTSPEAGLLRAAALRVRVLEMAKYPDDSLWAAGEPTAALARNS